MPNTIQIRGSQIQAETIEASNINLSGSFDFRAASQFIAATPSADADVATKGYVDGLIADGFQAGDGIDIDTATSPDTISVKKATDGALTFVGAGTDELSVLLNGSTLFKDASGLKVADGGIANAQIDASAAIAQSKLDLAITDSEVASGAAIAQSKLSLAITDSEVASGAAIAVSKLAASTISGVTLGNNLNSLSAGQGISMTSFNGSAAVSDLTINLDGSTLSKSASGLKVGDGGITATQLLQTAGNEAVVSQAIRDGAVSNAKLANDAVTSVKIQDGAVGTAKIANNAVDDSKISFEGAFDVFSPDGSTAAFNLSAQYLNGFEPQVMAFKNGLLMRLVASSPADADQYTVSDNGSVSTVTFGANLSADDTLEVRYIAQK